MDNLSLVLGRIGSAMVARLEGKRSMADCLGVNSNSLQLHWSYKLRCSQAEEHIDMREENDRKLVTELKLTSGNMEFDREKRRFLMALAFLAGFKTIPYSTLSLEASAKGMKKNPADEMQLFGKAYSESGQVFLLESSKEPKVLSWNDLSNEFDYHSLEETGPFRIENLKNIELISSLKPHDESEDFCMVKLHLYYPNHRREFLEAGGRFPLAVFSPGFLIESDQYEGYAIGLASHGYFTIIYDKDEKFYSPISDEISAGLISEIITWAQTHEFPKTMVDQNSVYLCGHSRGAKICVLTATRDSRVTAVTLIDPVDNTEYAPLSPGFPSAVSLLRAQKAENARNQQIVSPVPICIVGGGLAGECAPVGSNFSEFFEAASSPCWEVILKDTSHFQFLDSPSFMQKYICGVGSEGNETVRKMACAALVAWAKIFVPVEIISEAPSEVTSVQDSNFNPALTQTVLGISLGLGKMSNIISALKLQ